MRLLIGVYFALSVASFAVAVAIVGTAVSALVLPPQRGGPGVGEAVAFGAFAALSGVIPLVTAYGLWRRWRAVRLVLVGCSVWTLGVCGLIEADATLYLTGVIALPLMGHTAPTWEDVVLAAAYGAFAAWQWWVLCRPAVRASFRASGRTGPTEGDRV